MAPETFPDSELEVSAAAAHILFLLDSVADQLAAIRRTAERLVVQQEDPDASQP